jgi:hypothetical protein
LANKKTAKKRNKMPQIGDIISSSPTDETKYLVLDTKGYGDLPADKERRFFMLRLDDGSKRWYDYALTFRRWRLVV